MLYILWGEDAFSREEKLKQIKDSLGQDSMMSSNTHVFEGQKVSAEELAAVTEAAPFLAPKRLIIVTGLLERFGGKEKAPTAKKAAAGKGGDWQSFAGCLQKLPESSLVVLTDSLDYRTSPAKNNPLLAALAGAAEVVAFPALRGQQLFQWIQDRAAKKGGSTSRQATAILTELIGGDLFTLNNEIDKLSAYCAGRMIEEKDVRAVVSAAQETSIYAMVDAILDKKPALAEDKLQDLLQNGFAPAQILAQLARQAQLMLQIREMKSQRRSQSEIQSKVGVFNQYAWSKLSGRADKFSMLQIKAIYGRLLEADLAIKTGRFDGDLALDLLVAELSQA